MMPSSRAGLPIRTRPFPSRSAGPADTNINDSPRTLASHVPPIWPRNALLPILQQTPFQPEPQSQSRTQVLLARLQRLQHTLNDYGNAISILQFLVQKSKENPLHYPPYLSFLAHAKKQTDSYTKICDIATSINTFLTSRLTSPPDLEAEDADEALLSALEVRIAHLEGFTAQLLQDDKDNLTHVVERKLWGQFRENAAGLLKPGWKWEDASSGVRCREEESVDPLDASRPNNRLADDMGRVPETGRRGTDSEVVTCFSGCLTSCWD